MARRQLEHIIVIGAGAAGLMAARDLGRAGKRVTVLEARGRCGGRIHPLPTAEFGYPAEGGAEFVHREAPVTRGLLREAGLSLLPIQGARFATARAINGHMIRSPGERIRTQRPKRERRNRGSPARRVEWCSFPAKRCTAGGTWGRSRRRWRAAGRQPGAFFPVD
jgi:monoamine oxidase